MSAGAGPHRVAGAGSKLVATATLTATAAYAFTPLFAGTRHIPIVLAAAMIPFALAGMTLMLPRLPALLRAPLGLVGAGLVTVVGARPGGHLVDGPLRLVTGAIPFDPTGPELAAVALVVGIAAVAGAELAIAVRQPLAAASPAGVCLLLALALGASGEPPPYGLPVGLVVGVGALLASAALAGRARRSEGPRLAGAGTTGASHAVLRLVTATVIVAASTLVAWTVGGDAPGASARGERFDARDLVAEPVLPKTALSPLAALADLRAEPKNKVLFTVRADRPVERLRVATLTRFDGHLWSATGPYLRAGTTLPRGPSGRSNVTRTRLSVEVGDPAQAAWLPTPGSGRAVNVSMPGLGVDPDTGDLVVPADQHADTYHVISEEPDLSGVRDAVATTASYDPLPQAETLEQIHLPPIQEVVDEGSTSFKKLAAMQNYFRNDNSRFSRDDNADAASGHGLSQIERLLSYQRGTPEQYASAFAVIARHLGYDARVAVGFELDPPKPAGERVGITGASVYAWPEVHFEEIGWVPFDPTPKVVKPTKPPPESTAPSASDQVENAVEQEGTSPSRAGGSPDASAHGPDDPAGTPASEAPIAWRIAAAIALATAVAAAAVPVAKVVRRRRRRRATAGWVRVTGAWDEAVDRLVEQGVPVNRSMTSGELTTASVARLGQERISGLARLAALADTASFAPDGVEADDDTVAWDLCDQFRHAVASGIAPHRRIGHVFDPRPFTARRPRHRVRATQEIRSP